MKKIIYLIIALLFSAIIFTTISCEKESFTGDSGTFIDSRDNHEYKWIKVEGHDFSQIWMAENVTYQSVRDTCYSYSSTTDKNIYGKLYIWEAAKKEACPDGWHLPSMEEWETLIFDFLDESENELKFDAVSGGCYKYGDSYILGKGKVGCWWSSKENKESKSAEIVRIYHETNYIRIDDSWPKNYGLSVRCVKD